MDYVLQTISPDLVSFQALMDTLLAADIGIDRYMTYACNPPALFQKSASLSTSINSSTNELAPKPKNFNLLLHYNLD